MEFIFCMHIMIKVSTSQGPIHVRCYSRIVFSKIFKLSEGTLFQYLLIKFSYTFFNILKLIRYSLQKVKDCHGLLINLASLWVVTMNRFIDSKRKVLKFLVHFYLKSKKVVVKMPSLKIFILDKQLLWNLFSFNECSNDMSFHVQ